MVQNRARQIISYSRSRSLNTYHRSHHPPFRVNDNQSFNRLKTSIKNAFDIQDKHFHDVKELTSKVSPAQSQRINTMCVKYSICKDSRKSQRCSSSEVDVQFIARSYVRSKSRERKKQDQKNQLKQSIKLISRRYQQPKEKEFFKFECENLRQLNFHANNDCKQTHPYLKIYEKSQAQALATVLNRNKINLGKISDCPDIVEPEQWQKDQRKIKQMLATVKNLRNLIVKPRQRKIQKGQDSFFLS